MRPFRAASVFLMVVTALFCVGSKRALSQVVEAEPLIPQNLLKLVHTPEVQKELGLEGDARLLDVLRDVDRVWWPSRNLPEEKQVETTRELEKRLLDALAEILSPAKMRRLREVEMQSQGTRALLLPDVAKTVGLDAKAQRTIKAAFLETDSLARQLNEKRGGDADGLQSLSHPRAISLLLRSITTKRPLCPSRCQHAGGRP